MEINFDFLLAGCNTRCKHCYVNGGPAPMMTARDAFACIQKLDEIAESLPQGTSFTLDNEPINHPDICAILDAAAATSRIRYFHHGMTTGIALMRRPDRDVVTDSYLSHGCRTFGITLHGIGKNYDELVCGSGAFAHAIQAADYIKSRGCHLEVSLMLNRFFAEDGDGMIALLEECSPDSVYFAVPVFAPHKRMMAFEPYRATFEQLEQFRNLLRRWRRDIVTFPNPETVQTPETVAERFEAGLSLHELFSKPQQDLYLSLHHDARLFVGNTGAETACLGDLRTADPMEIARKISALPGNRDYGAFYEKNDLPQPDALMKVLKSLPQSTAFGDFASVVYRALTEMNVRTALIKER